MYFDFEDLHPDTPHIEPAVSKRDGVLVSVLVHAALFGLLLILPPLGQEARQEAIRQAEEVVLAQQQALELERQRQRDEQRFVFVQPRVELEAQQAPERAELSDLDREARTIERAEEPTSPLPFARGNSAERIIAEELPVEEPLAELRPEEVVDIDEPAEAGEIDTLAAGQDDGVEGLDALVEDGSPELQQQLAALLEESRSGLGRSNPNLGAPSPAAGTPLGEALRNLQRYVDTESFSNPQGGDGRIGSWIDFDTKGVEFGPWIRRFVAQVRRNWIVPHAVRAFHGRVVVTFNVHKNGALTDLTVQRPSSIDGFNVSSYNALLGSNPTYPLPPEYPDDMAFFTVTFFYNESPE